MIYGFTVVNPKEESLYLELSKPESSGLIVKEIKGLGPGDADINITDIVTTDFGLFTGARRNIRNIVITLMMMFDPLIEDARLRTYRYFPLKKKVKLIFKTDNRLSEIEGYVESNEPDIFSKEETTQISILCPDPNFYVAGDEYQLFTGVQPKFEFPFSNESLKGDLIEFGEMLQDDRITFEYEGDSDTGMIITLHMSGGVEDFVLWNVDTREKIALDSYRITQITGGAIDLGDDIIISTMPGNKTVQLLRKGKYYNIIGALSRDSDWPQVTQGTNTYTFTASKGDENVLAIFQFKPAYSGI